MCALMHVRICLIESIIYIFILLFVDVKSNMAVCSPIFTCWMSLCTICGFLFQSVEACMQHMYIHCTFTISLQYMYMHCTFAYTFKVYVHILYFYIHLYSTCMVVVVCLI